MQDYQQIDGLWAEWQDRMAQRPGDPPEAVLGALLRGHGTKLSRQDVAFALNTPDPTARQDTVRFTHCMVALLGAPGLRLRHAFAAFPADAAGTIARADLLVTVTAFTEDSDRAMLMLDEIDADGDGRISLADITDYLAEHKPAQNAYRASHVPAHHIGADPAPPLHAVAPSPAVVQTRHSDTGISPHDLRIGFFRLMQGAAYRSFRANYAANSETHLRARNLPYTIDDFARFTTATIDYYLSLGLVTDPRCVAEFRHLDCLVQDELARLHARVADWPAQIKTAAMRAAQSDIADIRDGLTQRRSLCHAVIEFIIALQIHGVPMAAAGSDILARFEINRLRHGELRAEHRQASKSPPPTPQIAYLDSWNGVILSGTDPADPIDGAIMPTRFWYETFMPQLVLCASLLNDDDLQDAQQASEAELDSWHASHTSEGRFDQFATDLRDGFPACTRAVKLMLRQAWTLTVPYLAGVEKLREREEFGRDSGFLSEYVAFIDIHLGRHDIALADMRLSFPYYIGPAVWGLLHGSAELVEAIPGPARQEAIDRFLAFFRAFATMYPCPYCRYHLNRYVIRNSEADMYPLEFVLLGRDPGQHDAAISLDAKLATISADAPGSLRMFLWKLHNAVSSSIARTEPWYHRQAQPLYTTRFWPSIEAELARASALGLKTVALDKIADLFSITKPAAHLAMTRQAFARAFDSGDLETLSETIDSAERAIADLSAALDSTDYLRKTYALDYTKHADNPPVDAQLEALARSGLFIER